LLVLNWICEVVRKTDGILVAFEELECAVHT
jgi:hypothetical protein